MSFKTPTPKPWLLPWVDLEPLRGQTVFGVSIPNSAGLYKSVFHLGPQQAISSMTDFQNHQWGCDLNGLFFTYTAGINQYPRITSVSNSNMGSPFLPPYISNYPGMRVARFLKTNSTILDFFPNTTVNYRNSSNSSSSQVMNFYTYRSNYFLQTQEVGPFLFKAIGAAQLGSITFIEGYNSTATSDSKIDLLPITRYYDETNRTTAEYLFQFVPIGYKMTRTLPNAPVLVESCTSVDHVTIGGRTYHSQHSRRKLWQCELLLDGALDTLGQENDIMYTRGNGEILDAGLDAETGWNTFLKWAEKGVTLLIDSDLGIGEFIRPKWAVAFPGSPNIISGQLIDCSKLTLKQPNNLNRRYSVTVTIAEEEPF